MGKADPSATTAVSADTLRERIMRRLEDLDRSDLFRVELYVRAILEDDPVLWSLATAPEDDEPVTDEERRAIEESRTQAARGERYPLEDVIRELRSS